MARAAGVGKSTVSNVLNGTGRVGEAARIRVLETVEQLGYQPHQGARSMRSRRTMRLAYLMPPIQLQPTNLIMMAFLQALLTAAAAGHFRVLVVPQAEDPQDDIRRLVAGRSVDAFVLSDSNRPIPGPSCCSGSACRSPASAGPTSGGHWPGSTSTTRRLRPTRWPTSSAGATGGRVTSATRPVPTGMPSARPASGPGWPPRGSPPRGTGVLRLADDATARADVHQFLTAARPNAVLTGLDKIAIIVYGAAADLSLRIGRDLAVVGFDGSVGAALLQPPLTSVVIPVEDVATRIVARLPQRPHRTRPG